MKSQSTLRIARVVAGKDLQIEFRSHVVINRIVPFAALVMVMFAFALDDDLLLARVAGGLVWLATLFSLFIIVQRSFAIETADGALDALRVAGVNPAGIFLGKALALVVQLFLLEITLIGAAIVLYRVHVEPSSAVLLVTCMFCATLGLAFVGTIFGGLAAGMRGRETLLPLLMLPAIAPVLIGATKATEAAFNTSGMVTSEGWPWVGLLAVFAAVFGVGGLSAFSSLIEE
ncbi:MAG: heme exporter protein CcmB [Ilumatobacteraceae bacterium]